MGGPFNVKKLAIVDTETTGLDFKRSRVLQYGVVYVTFPLLEIECVRDCYVDPSLEEGFDWSSTNPAAMRIHGISPEFLRSRGELPCKALRKMFRSIEDRSGSELHHVNWEETLFSAWGNDFDVGMVKAEYARYNSRPPFKYRTFDVRSAAASLDMQLHMEESPIDEELEFGFTSVGLMDWMERMGRHPFVVRMKEQGAFEDINRHLEDRKAHDALHDALMTLAALRIVQRFNLYAVNFLASAELIVPVGEEEV